MHSLVGQRRSVTGVTENSGSVDETSRFHHCVGCGILTDFRHNSGVSCLSFAVQYFIHIKIWQERMSYASLHSDRAMSARGLNRDSVGGDGFCCCLL
jgi:hypothetical protein